MSNELSELLAEVRRIKAQSARLVTSIMAGGYSSVFRGSGIEFDNIREYSSGDDPRAIDSNVTARTGRPFVKEYVEERELTMVFLLDLSASMQHGSGYWSSRQMAARVTACLALSAIRNDDRVGLIAVGDAVEVFVPPRKGTRHALRIIRECLALPAARQTNLATGLEHVSRAIRRRVAVFVLSDFLTPASPQLDKALSICGRRHDLIAVRLLPPEALRAPAARMVTVEDPETARRMLIDWSSRTVRNAYEKRLEAWDQQLRSALHRARIDLMDVPIPANHDPEAVVRPILDLFRRRDQRSQRR